VTLICHFVIIIYLFFVSFFCIIPTADMFTFYYNHKSFCQEHGSDIWLFLLFLLWLSTK